MTATVLDASAVLAFAFGGSGADAVATALERGAFCGAANWAEIVQKLARSQLGSRAATSILRSYGLTVVPVTQGDAERAAELWQHHAGLSLAGRLCLALADRLEVPALTADRAWVSKHPRAQLIR